MRKILLFALTIVLVYVIYVLYLIRIIPSLFVNKRTSEIGYMCLECISTEQQDSIFKNYSISKISDSIFINGLKFVENHFTLPEKIIYFQEYPREIIGFTHYNIEVAFNPLISKYSAVSGLSPNLSDKEQIRIRNRVLTILYPYECPKGKKKMLECMLEPAPFSEMKESD